MTFGSQAWVASQQPAHRLEVQVRVWPSLLHIGAAMLLLALGGFAGYASLVTHGPRAWILWPAGLLMAALGIVLLVITVALLVARKPALVIDAEGFRHALYGSVAWSGVAGLALEYRNKKASLTIGLVPGADLAGGWRWLRAIQRTRALWMPVEGMDHSPEQIFQAALAARERVQPPRIANWHYSFSPRLVAALLENDRLLAEAEEIARRPKPGPKDIEEALANAERMGANTTELTQAFQDQGKATRRSLRTLTYTILVVTVLYGLLLVVRIALLFR